MPVTPPPRKRRKEARPAELLAAALTQFVDKGYAATRLEDVARQAGVSKGTLYLYFDNKEALFKAVVQDGIVPVLAEGETIAAGHAGDSFTLLERLLDTWWSRIGNTAYAGIPKLIIAEAGNFPEIAAFYYEQVISRGRALVIAALRRGIEHGEFRPVDVETTTDVILAPILMLLVWRHSPGGCRMADGDPRLYLRTHLNLVCRGLTRPPHPVRV